MHSAVQHGTARTHPCPPACPRAPACAELADKAGQYTQNVAVCGLLAGLSVGAYYVYTVAPRQADQQAGGAAAGGVTGGDTLGAPPQLDVSAAATAAAREEALQNK